MKTAMISSCSERAAADLLADLRRRGHVVAVAPCGALSVSAATALTAEDRRAIAAAKVALLALLAAEAASPALPAYVRDLADATRAAYGDDAAARQVEAEVAWLATPRTGFELAEDLKRWPPGARYALADLERAGTPRTEAAAAVRALPGASSLHWDRRRWPEDAKRAYWSLVKSLNAHARETGHAVEGRARWARDDAERAVREAWNEP